MSEKEPTGPYVYQPYGSVTHPERAKNGRLFGVGGVGFDTMGFLEKIMPGLATLNKGVRGTVGKLEIKGLTRVEAEKIVEALEELASKEGAREGKV